MEGPPLGLRCVDSREKGQRPCLIRPLGHQRAVAGQLQDQALFRLYRALHRSHCPDTWMSEGERLVLGWAHRVCLAPKPPLLPLHQELLRRGALTWAVEGAGRERESRVYNAPPHPSAEGGLRRGDRLQQAGGQVWCVWRGQFPLQGGQGHIHTLAQEAR